MNNNSKYNNLIKLRDILVEKQYQLENVKHYIPSTWIDHNNNSEIIPVNFPQFLVNKIDEVIQLSTNQKSDKQQKIRIYNSLVRLTTAFNHKQNTFSLAKNNIYFKDEGTFVKTIALLPYLKRLEITHLYLLPITEIGLDGKKGKLGSPYSIKNHKKIDANLSEPLLEMSVEEQFKALVEACHLVGIDVILEMVFRTSSKDNDLILEHPDWFYWIKSNKLENTFKPPKFEEKELMKIKDKVESGDYENLIAPKNDYIDKFTNPPLKIWREDNKIYGLNEESILCEIPGAFADWPPDDTQPLWSDVTYLKLHNHPQFNYIAYNTIRMYDAELFKEEYRNKELWDYLSSIIPYYVEEFDIDGVMIDMGHALPKELLALIIEKAKKSKDNLLFLEENFVISNSSIEKGFEVVVGYLPFDLHNLDKTINLINELNNPQLKIKYFGTPETHNTPRAYWRTNSTNFSIFSYLLSNLMNNSVPFIHNGFELLERIPVNTGLGFEVSDISQFPMLPLFDYAELSWLNKEGNIINEIIQINKLINSNEFVIDKATKSDDDLLKISIKYNSNRAVLIVNYSNDIKRIKSAIEENRQKTIILKSDVQIDSSEVVFNSIFAFILFSID